MGLSPVCEVKLLSKWLWELPKQRKTDVCKLSEKEQLHMAFLNIHVITLRSGYA